jgi:hypothetical protein
MERRKFPYEHKLKQLIVQFAFKIPPRKELDFGEKRTLESVLKDLDSEHFQLFEENISRRSSATLLQVIRQLPIGPGTIMIPSFVFTRESFSFIWPVYMMDRFVLNFNSFDTSDMNMKIAGWVVKVQNAISNLSCQRTGKIYEIILGPFNQDEKKSIFQGLFSIELKDVGELNLTFTRYIDLENFIYNIHTNINYGQRILQDVFDVLIRVDINNRELERSMEPALMQKVWNFADRIINSHLERILKV